ncbi:folate-binding protein [Rhodobacteraceae bacterium 2CG4]|uniref:Folate-binding protein n=1 Tax=Halovulum marinum TaxID=2662447 RepID=A0A6L5YWE1_9RHOB|nr:folate-binding protein YgfZ [Halovulum marinum]MSU88636.1 folate-binding protein [Halovulum marinum]
MTRAFQATDRAVFRISGADHRRFLQDLVTNSLDGLGQGAVYAALLTPQGKYLADFFLIGDGDGVLLDADAAQAPDLVQRLGMYKLRAQVAIAPADLSVVQGWDGGHVPAGALADPRDPALGWRLYTDAPGAALEALEPADPADWHALRVALAVPQAGVELIPNDSFILEAGFDRLHGVDFRKGCYVGQEVTARMRHKTELRKGLVRVELAGDPPPPGTPIETAEGKSAGTLYSVAGGFGLAHLRFDRATGPLTAAGVPVLWPGAADASDA